MKTSRLAVPANPCEVAQQRALVSRHPLEIRHRIPTEWYHQLFAALLCLGAIGQSVEAAAVNLAWNPNPEPDIAGYLISYGTSPGNYSSTQATGNVTSATLSGLQEGQTYYFSLKAVNTAGLQSASSAEVSQYVELAAPVNQAPVAIGQTVITDKYTAVPITLAASDANGDALVYTIVNAPSMGSLSGTAPNLTYTPRGSGTDQFQFAVSDGAFTSNLGTVSITISEQPIELTSQILDRSLTSIHSVSSEETNGEDGRAVNAIDGASATYWCSKWSILPPHYIALDLGASRQISGMRYSPTKDGDPDGNITRYEIHTSTDGTNWTLRASGTWTANGSDRDVAFSPVTGRYIKLTSTADRYGCASEVQAFCMLPNLQLTSQILDRSLTSIHSVSSEETNAEDSGALKAIDGISSTYWCSKWSILPPHYIALDLGASRQISGMRYSPTKDGDPDGNITRYEIHTSTDGTNWTLRASGTWTANGSDRDVAFSPVTGRYIKLTSTADRYGCASEVQAFCILPSVDNPPPPPPPPTLTAQSLNVQTDEDVAIGITLSGTHSKGAALSYVILTQPTRGTLSGTAPNLTYTPIAGQSGADSFTYKTNDGAYDSNTATVSITINPVNSAPIAASQSVSTDEDTAVAVTLAANDADGDSLIYTIVNGPSMGTLSGTAPQLTYTPLANVNGNDSFTFRVGDGTANSNTATVSITVRATNDTPLAQSQEVIALEDKSVGISLYATDKDADSLSYRIVGAPAKGRLSGTAPNLTYTPDRDLNGSDSFTFVANDGTTDSGLATVLIAITPVNDAPVAAARFVSTDADKPAVIVLSANDKDGDALTYAIVSQPMKGVLTGTPPRVTYTPYPGAEGSDSLSFRVHDGTVNSNTASVSITLVPVVDPNANEAPEFQFERIRRAKAKVGVEYTSTSLAGTAIDPEGESVIYTRSSGPEWLVVSPDGSISGTPTQESQGVNSFTIRAMDAGGAYSEASLEIEVESNGLPLPWTLATLGSVHELSEASGDQSAIRLLSSGVLAGTADSGLFAWQTLSGDGAITVRIRELENTDTATRVGLMIRESLAANSKHTFVGTDGRGYVRWIRRTKPDGGTSTSSVAVAAPLGLWLRLIREGTVVSAFTSSNGSDWTRVGRVNVDLGTTCYFGLSAHSGSADKLSAAVFDNITVTP
jgi:hypothetical protein